MYPWDERREILPFIPPHAASVLDVGCGRGAFGFALRSTGFTGSVHAIDSDREAVEAAAPHYDQLHLGEFPRDLPPGDTFDCIVFNDVLEHMVDPWSVLIATQQHLASDGTVVASIPNMRYWPALKQLVFQGRWTYVESGVLDRTHLRWFTRSTMVELFETTGFIVRDVQPINRMDGTTRLRRLRFLAPSFIDDVSTKQYVVVAVRLPERTGTDQTNLAPSPPLN